ncbi:MAG: hypothetical protein Alpg2KO_11930 [Alphaproteobacteria bacterium]
MNPQHILVVVVAMCMFNGLQFPWFFEAFLFMSNLTPWATFAGGGAMLYITSLTISTATLLIGMLPAAIYERLTGAKESNVISMGIWLAATAVLVSPTFKQMVVAAQSGS